MAVYSSGLIDWIPRPGIVVLMSRPLRIDLAGGVYHVTARGDQRGAIYFADADRRAWLDVLGEVCERYGWRCHAWCQMTNHYHLLIETPEGNLSHGMRQVNGVYTQYVNRAYRRVGHLFQGRYKAILVEKEAYLLEVARYVVLNPVRAFMVDTVGEWPWSSYSAMVRHTAVASWMERDWLLGQFGMTRSAAIAAYADFVRAGVGQEPIWSHLRGQLYLGDEAFVADMQNRGLGGDLREVPRMQRRAPPRPLTTYSGAGHSRHEAMARAYLAGGYSQREIADHFGVHYATVSRAVKRFKAAERVHPETTGSPREVRA